MENLKTLSKKILNSACLPRLLHNIFDKILRVSLCLGALVVDHFSPRRSYV